MEEKDIKLIVENILQENRQKDVLKEKNVEFYSNTLQAWYATKMEKDKSILTLSSGAIGLLATFINAYGVETQCQIVLYIIAMLSFLISIGSSLWIFSHNAIYLEKVILKEDSINDPTLGFLDKSLNLSFIIGIIFTILISILSISNQEKDKNMADNKPLINKNETLKEETNLKQVDQSINVTKDLQSLNESFNGASNMRPAATQPVATSNNDTLNKSLDGASKLRPVTEKPQDTQDTDDKK